MPTLMWDLIKLQQRGWALHKQMCSLKSGSKLSWDLPWWGSRSRLSLGPVNTALIKDTNIVPVTASFHFLPPTSYCICSFLSSFPSFIHSPMLYPLNLLCLSSHSFCLCRYGPSVSLFCSLLVHSEPLYLPFTQPYQNGPLKGQYSFTARHEASKR